MENCPDVSRTTNGCINYAWSIERNFEVCCLKVSSADPLVGSAGKERIAHDFVGKWQACLGCESFTCVRNNSIPYISKGWFGHSRLSRPVMPAMKEGRKSLISLVVAKSHFMMANAPAERPAATAVCEKPPTSPPVRLQPGR